MQDNSLQSDAPQDDSGRESLGIIFGETSTQEFSFLFGADDEHRQLQLKYAYIEADLEEEGKIVVAYVYDVNTDNPLLAQDTAKFYSEIDETFNKPNLMSSRFTLYQVKCKVIGEYDKNTQTGNIVPLTQPITPGKHVKRLSEDVLRQIFSENEPWHLPIGYVETPGEKTQARVSLDSDSIITMHAAVFGMTGMGKTTTTAVLLEELMFRGAKTIVFDPHADYVNINQMDPKLYEKHFQKRVENDEELANKIEAYRVFLKEEWSDAVEPWNDFDPAFDSFNNQQNAFELTDHNLFYRWLNFSVINHPDLMIDFPPNEELDSQNEKLDSQVDAVIERIKQSTLGKDIPPELVKRRLAINFNVFPTIRLYENKSPYFTMRLIGAIAGESFSETQEGIMIEWLDNLSNQNLLDDGLLGFLENRAFNRDRNDSSRTPLLRIIRRAKRTIKSLIERNCQSLDVRKFVDDFCGKDKTLSQVSTAVFNLSTLENDFVRRVLISTIMEFAFDKYKSGEYSIGSNAYPVLFALEEARTLIPQQVDSNSATNPATSAARSAARQIATEGRKMGLGMLVISQKPAAVDQLTVSQANTFILHRVINPDDQNYIRQVGESLDQENLDTLKRVKPGIALVTGNALKTTVMSPLVKVRNRYSKPGKDKPTPIADMWKEYRQSSISDEDSNEGQE